MNKNIDYTLEEILENQQNGILSGISKTTIKKCIIALENRYFKNANIFRNNNKSSDYLFRFEIKDLLLLLIKLENDDPFSDGKSLKNGVSDKSIEKLLNGYQMFKNNHNLESYERQLLHSKYNIDESIKTIKEIKAFQDNFTSFFMLVVKNYTSFTSDFFEDIIEQIKKWSYLIIINSEEKKCITEDDVVLKLDKNAGLLYKTDQNLTISLKIAVVKAIKEIASMIYRFDNNGICYRKPFMDKFATGLSFTCRNKNKNERDSSRIIEFFKRLYLDVFDGETEEDIDLFYKITVDSEDDNLTIENNRNKVIKLLNQYYCYILQGKAKTERNVSDIDAVIIKRKIAALDDIKNSIGEYLKYAYILRTILSNKSDINFKLPDDMIHIVLHSYNYFRTSYIKMGFNVDSFENKFWKIIEPKKYKSINNVLEDGDVVDLVEEYLLGFLDFNFNTSKDEISGLGLSEILKIYDDINDPRNHKECIRHNVEKLSKDVRGIMENMLAMILKLEDENFRENIWNKKE